MWETITECMKTLFRQRTQLDPVSACFGLSAFDRMLHDYFCVRDGGVIVFRGDSRPPAEIFNHGFKFSLDSERAADICCNLQVDAGGSAPVVAHPLYVVVNAATAKFVLHATKLEMAMGLATSLFLTNSYASYAHPSSWCGLNLTDDRENSAIIALSFSKSFQYAANYPIGPHDNYIYACYIPAPYIDLGDLYRRDYPRVYDFKKTDRRKDDLFPLKRHPANHDDPNDHQEVFPLGVPELPRQYVLGAWKGYFTHNTSTGKGREIEKRFIDNKNVLPEAGRLLKSHLHSFNDPFHLMGQKIISKSLTKIFDAAELCVTQQPPVR